jgi:hypothetical protein
VSAADHPIGLDRAAAYLLGELADADQDRVEAHYFGCPECARAVASIEALCAGIAAQIPPVVSAAAAARLRERFRLGETRIAPGGDADVYFTPEVDLLLHHLVADLTGVERVDVELFGPGGQPLITMFAVPFDPGAGAVFIACQRHFASFPSDIHFQVVAIGAGEQRRPLGRYLVRHHF